MPIKNIQTVATSKGAVQLLPPTTEMIRELRSADGHFRYLARPDQSYLPGFA